MESKDLRFYEAIDNYIDQKSNDWKEYSRQGFIGRAKQIKELEQENNFLEKRNEELIIDRRDICLERNDIFEENQQLKQQLHDLSKKIVGEIKKELYDCGKTYLEDEPYIEICIVKGILNTILKKYGGQEGDKE